MLIGTERVIISHNIVISNNNDTKANFGQKTKENTYRLVKWYFNKIK